MTTTGSATWPSGSTCEIGEKLDTELFQLFEPPGVGIHLGAQTLRDQRQTLIQAATQYSGVNRAVVRERASTTSPIAPSSSSSPPHRIERADTWPTSARCITALAMNELYTGRLFDTE